LVSVLALVALVLAVAAALLLWRAPATNEATRFFVSPPEGWNLAVQTQGGPAVGPLAVSPDGRQVAFVARNASAQNLIWLRSLNTLDAKGLAGTEGGSSPFWSPDSRSLGFFSDGKLKTIEISGGPPIVLCDATPGISGTWSPSGVIVFSPAPATALLKVSATGGAPTPATALEAGEAGHARPTFLPDGRHFVFRPIHPTVARNVALVGSLDSTERTRLMEVDSTNVLYSQGHLLFLSETTLMAQAFDPDRLATQGDPFPVAERIQTFGGPPSGFFSVSGNGVLAYQSGTATNKPQLTWVDRAGMTLGTVGEPASYADMVLSHDGSKAAVSLANNGQPGSDVWIVDLNREGLPSRLTFDEGLDITPVWSPDGSRIAFSSSVVSGNFDLYVKSASGAGEPQRLVSGKGTQAPLDWSNDGRFLLYASDDPGPGFDLWILPTTGGAKPFPFLRAPGNQGQGQFSPDGSWIAYRSVESGLSYVYVAPFDGLHAATGERYQISTGGSVPRWRADGKEIFYVSQSTGALMSAGVSSTASTFQADAVRTLFPLRPAGNQRFNYEYAPSPDGQRFLVNMGPSVDAPQTPITVVLNWLAGVRR
jgi:Tol biopolymer transport system component